MLANEKDQATLEALRDALTASDWSVRAAAIHALALRRDPQPKSEITSLLVDAHEAVRLRAEAGYLSVTIRRERTGGNARVGLLAVRAENSRPTVGLHSAPYPTSPPEACYCRAGSDPNLPASHL